MSTITTFTTRGARFPLAPGAGSDADHPAEIRDGVYPTPQEPGISSELKAG